jgi:flagellar hook-basal body protein
MSLSMQKMNLFAQNLSNAQTTGYKKKTYSVHSFEDMMVNLPDVTDSQRYDKKMPIATGSYLDTAGIKQQQGRLKQTGNSLDVAVMGEKLYFQMIQKPQLDPKTGQPLANQPVTHTISRDGAFMIDKESYLVSHQGDYVLDAQNKRIRLTSDPKVAQLPPDPNRKDMPLDPSRIRIDQYGRIYDTADKTKDAKGELVARAQLKLVQWTENGEVPQTFVEDPNATPEVPATETQRLLKKYGVALPDDHELLTASMDLKGNHTSSIVQAGPRKGLPVALQAGQPVPLQASLKQGYLETSNVDITQEMISLMMTSKDFDMSQKLIAAEDKILDKTINEMGRLQ